MAIVARLSSNEGPSNEENNALRVLTSGFVGHVRSVPMTAALGSSDLNGRRAAVVVVRSGVVEEKLMGRLGFSAG